MAQSPLLFLCNKRACLTRTRRSLVIVSFCPWFGTNGISLSQSSWVATASVLRVMFMSPENNTYLGQLNIFYCINGKCFRRSHLLTTKNWIRALYDSVSPSMNSIAIMTSMMNANEHPLVNRVNNVSLHVSSYKTSPPWSHPFPIPPQHLPVPLTQLLSCDTPLKGPGFTGT